MTERSGIEPVIVLTGLSGSGKSLAARSFEDVGYFCIDNLPVTLIPLLVDLLAPQSAGPKRIALVVDVREGEMLRDFPRIITDLRSRNVPVSILYFEAADDVLIRRFSETRRPHPLDSGTGLKDAISRERVRLGDVRDLAHRIIDTSQFNAHELRAFLRKELDTVAVAGEIQVSVVSFGFKYGLPPDADLVFDLRFVPNPFFVEELRDKTGLDTEVREFLEGQEPYRRFLEKTSDLLDFLLPGYVREGKSYLTIAVGCTGGRHRSVAASRRLAERLEQSGFPARLTHRDVRKE